MPYYGPTSGGTEVDIFGAGFAEGMTVEFGGTSATNVTFIDSGQIVATTPAHFGGWVNIKVTKASGASAELDDMFFFEDTTPPIVTPVVTGTLGANGWYTSDVTRHLDGRGRRIGHRHGAVSAVFTDDRFDARRYATCYAASWGGETFREVQIKRDTVPPTATFNEPQDGTRYSFGQVVPLGLDCADAMSGIASVRGEPAGPESGYDVLPRHRQLHADSSGCCRTFGDHRGGPLLDSVRVDP